MRALNRFAAPLAIVAILPLAGCNLHGFRPSGSLSTAGVAPAAAASCRRQADTMFLKQNRVLLSERDTRDSPFSSTGISGITTEGLGDRYGRDRMLADCLAANRRTAPDASTR